MDFEISDLIPAPPQVAYDTWLDSEGHAAITGSPATVGNEVRGDFSVRGGDINGKNLEMLPGELIRQSWLIQQSADSELEITLELEGTGTRLTLKYTNLMGNGTHYKTGRVEYYFEPMEAYF